MRPSRILPLLAALLPQAASAQFLFTAASLAVPADVVRRSFLSGEVVVCPGFGACSPAATEAFFDR